MSQLRYADLSPGDGVPPLVKRPTTRQLVMWAGASGDYNPIHYDQDFTRGRGLPGVIVPGQLVYGFLGQMLTDWVGEDGSLRRLSVSYKGMNFPGEEIACRGEVTKKHVADGEGHVECRVWVENGKGERTVVGTAVVVMPAV